MYTHTRHARAHTHTDMHCKVNDTFTRPDELCTYVLARKGRVQRTCKHATGKPAPMHTNTHTYTLTRTHTHALSFLHTYTLTLTQQHTQNLFLSLTHTRTHTHTVSLSLSLSVSLSLSFSFSLYLFLPPSSQVSSSEQCSRQVLSSWRYGGLVPGCPPGQGFQVKKQNKRS